MNEEEFEALADGGWKYEVESLRQQLAAAIAAIKIKNHTLEWLSVKSHTRLQRLRATQALAIQPDDAALKAWLGEPHSYLYKFNSEFGDGTFWSHRPTHNGADALETIPLYKPKELK